jgi:midasin
LEDIYSPSVGTTPISFDRVRCINIELSQILHAIKQEVVSCAEECHGIMPSSIFASCISNVGVLLKSALALVHSTNESESTDLANENALSTLKLISNFVQNTLISAQSVYTSKICSPGSGQLEPIEDDVRVCNSHTKMVNEWEGMHLATLINKMHELSNSLQSLHGIGAPSQSSRSLCMRSAINSFALARNILDLSKCRLKEAAIFYQHHSKLLYVLLRVFRVLIAKGFCSDDVSDGGEGDGEGGAGEMKFEDDVEGTGMGEGEGKNDVTDQIENEEQLLGLKGDDQQEASSSKEKKELNQDEVDTGMEMEGDFEGDTYDMPEQQDQNEDREDGDNEEEIDREMGDGKDPNEQVSYVNFLHKSNPFDLLIILSPILRWLMKRCGTTMKMTWKR